MSLKQTIEMYELLDSATITGKEVSEYLTAMGDYNCQVTPVQGKNGRTDFVQVDISGIRGKGSGGDTPTLGVIGRLGGIGARPSRVGFVSDRDGALVALATACKLLDMQRRGDRLLGDVIVCTHVCTHAPTVPHDPVLFLGSPIDIGTMNGYEVDYAMDGIISVDTTKGNQVVNSCGIAVSPTVKEGYILRVSDDLLSLLEVVTC